MAAPPPNKPDRKVPKQDPIDQIVSEVKALHDRTLLCNNAEEGQRHLKSMDETLQFLAQAQKDIGLLRRQAGKHVANIRQAHPKGKPDEGSTRTTPSGKFVYLDGRWNPLGDQTTVQGKKE